MRAAVLREVGKPLVIVEVALEGPREGEVRLRIVASGICGSDLSNANGTLRTPLPVVLGHEAAGEVLETGAGVEEPARGDRVVVSLSPECGECLFCQEGKPHFCVQMMPGMLHSTLVDGTTRLRAGGEAIHQLCGVGSFAEEAVVCARSCIRVPDDLPLERVCLLGCGVLTGAGAALNTARVQPGMCVAVRSGSSRHTVSPESSCTSPERVTRCARRRGPRSAMAPSTNRSRYFGSGHSLRANLPPGE